MPLLLSRDLHERLLRVVQQILNTHCRLTNYELLRRLCDMFNLGSLYFHVALTTVRHLLNVWRELSLSDGAVLTSSRCTGSSVCEATDSSCAYSRYSTIRCRKLNGSFTVTGIVIFDRSYSAYSNMR